MKQNKKVSAFLDGLNDPIVPDNDLESDLYPKDTILLTDAMPSASYQEDEAISG